MKAMKKLSALMMAVAMVLTGAAGVTADAADPAITISGTTVSSDTFKEGDTISRIEFTVEDITVGIGPNAVTKTATIAMDSKSDFTGGSIQIPNIYPSNTATDLANFKVVALNVKAGAKASTMKFTVNDTANGKTYSRKFEVNIPGFSDGTPVPPPKPDTPTPTTSNGNYELAKVFGARRNSNNTGDIPSEKPRFDISEGGRGDATIRPGYFADISVRITAGTGGAIPAGITDADILKNLSNGKKQMGSFLYDPSATSTIGVSSVEGKYIDITFTAMRYSGNGKKLTFSIDNAKYYTDVSVEVIECMTTKEQSAENDKHDSTDNDNKVESETPYVIVSKYGYGGGSVTAGETFTLSMTFQNTSETKVVGNMMITITMPDDLMLTSSSNTFYVPELEKKQSITKSVQVTAKPAAKVQSHNIAVAMKYQYVDEKVNSRKDAATSETIAIPVIQIDRFEVTNVDIPMDIALEEESSVTVNFVNKGRSDVYNLSASISGDVTNPGQNQNLGNLASGVAGTADFFIKPKAAGTLTGEITITYEDTNMERKTATIPYTANVKTMEEMSGGDMMMGGMIGGGMVPGMGETEAPPAEEKSKMPIYIGAGMAVVVIAGIVVKKRMDKKRREREDADL